MVTMTDLQGLIGKWRERELHISQEGAYFISLCIDDLSVLIAEGAGTGEVPTEEQDALRTLKSLAAMLGWMNLPPRHIFEAEIRALKARASAPPEAQIAPPTNAVAVRVAELRAAHRDGQTGENCSDIDEPGSCGTCETLDAAIRALSIAPPGQEETR